MSQNKKSLETLFSELSLHAAADEYTEVLAAAQSILATRPADVKAQTAVAVANIRLSKFDDAVAALQSMPQPLSADNQYLLAYAYYKLNKTARTIQLLTDMPEAERASTKVRHLTAQSHYRNANYDAAANIYQTLVDEADVDADDYVELVANTLCAYAAGGQVDRAQKLLQAKSLPKTYDIAYNTACIFIEKHDYAAALTAVDTAIRLCRESLLADKFDEAEIESETAALNVQRAYIMQMMGQTDKAMDIYTHVLSSKTH